MPLFSRHKYSLCPCSLLINFYLHEFKLTSSRRGLPSCTERNTCFHKFPQQEGVPILVTNLCILLPQSNTPIRLPVYELQAICTSKTECLIILNSDFFLSIIPFESSLCIKSCTFKSTITRSRMQHAPQNIEASSTYK